MSSATFDEQRDPESLEISLISPDRPPPPPPKNRWRQSLLVVYYAVIFHSLVNDAEQNSPTVQVRVPSSGATIHEQRDPESLEISLINPARPTPPKNHWRQLQLAFRAPDIFHSPVNDAEQNSLSPTTQPRVTSSAPNYYTTLDNHNAAGVSISVDSDQVLLDDIAKMVKEKDLGRLNEFGGVQGIAVRLHTHLQDGLDEDTCNRRQNKPNLYSNPQSTEQRWFHFVLKACNNSTIPLLVICAVLSFGFGIKEDGLQKGWYDGAIVLLAVLVLVSATSVGNWWRARVFNRQLKEKEIKCSVDVVRGGKRDKISISNVVRGDIICLKIGDQIPADGLFVNGESLMIDDMPDSIINTKNPFVFDGTEVINGHGRMLATCCGKNTALSEIMSLVATHHDEPNKKTPLQKQIDKVYACTQVITLLISILILVSLFLRHELGKKMDDDESGRPDVKGKPTYTHEFTTALERILIRTSRGPINTLITSLVVFLVGLQEGLPLVITLSIAHWSKKVASNKATIQELLACVTMGSVTTICTDNIGGTMLNQMEVDIFRVGQEIITNDSVIDLNVCNALCHGMCTPVIVPHAPYSSTEDTILCWAGSKFGFKMENLRKSYTVIETKKLNSAEEASCVLMKKNKENELNMYLHWKGQATSILGMCSDYYDSKGAVIAIDERRRMEFENTIDDMVREKQLKTIAFAFKETNVPSIEDNNLILIGFLGLKKKPSEETGKMMEAIRNAGVNIKLISRDEVALQEVIANECEMLMPKPTNGRIEGQLFRTCTNKIEVVDQISIMENALPSDTVLLVKCLKQKGHVVAVIGGVRTIETPALKEADVGLTMGAWSTKMTRESSAIIIWYDICDFLINILRCGRCVRCNIQKFIQLELTMVIAELLIIAITTISSGDSPLTAFQVFFVNLIVPFLGGLSLLTEPPTEKLMDKSQLSRSATLITEGMWRNILIQSIYQAAILVIFHFKGQAILGINEKVCKIMIFNSFVLCQVFNQFNARELEKKYVFEGIYENFWFQVSVVSQVALQVAFVEIPGLYSITANLNFMQWGICSLLGMVSLVIDSVGKCISDVITEWITKLLTE